MTLDEKTFDAIYGAGMMDRVMALINDLAPVTRRDDWWATDGPYEMIAKHVRHNDSTITEQVFPPHRGSCHHG